MKVAVFPGQGAQFSGMGKDLYDNYSQAKMMFEEANDLLGFSITNIMFSGTEEELKMTKVTQPAVFLHSIIAYQVLQDDELLAMTAGHSLGEFTALVANKVLSFRDGLSLVSKRAHAMQKACEKTPSTMAVVLGFDNQKIEEICQSIDEVVVPANYNSPGQLVISGSIKGIELAVEALQKAGAKRVLPLKVSGAFHSPFMLSAQEELAEAISTTQFNDPICPIYQNCTGKPSLVATQIKVNLLSQLTSPVLWMQSVQNMIEDGATRFIEYGPGEVLQGLIKKIDPSVDVTSVKI